MPRTKHYIRDVWVDRDVYNLHQDFMTGIGQEFGIRWMRYTSPIDTTDISGFSCNENLTHQAIFGTGEKPQNVQGLHVVVFPGLPFEEADFEDVQKCIDRLLEVPDLSDRVHTIRTPKDLEVACQAFSRMKHIVLDFETSTLDASEKSARILCAAAGDGRNVWVMPFNHKQKSSTVESQRAFIEAVLRVPRFVAHNAKFELRWLLANGYQMPEVFFDPMVVHHLLDERSPHDLGHLTYLYAPDIAGYWRTLDSQVENDDYETAKLSDLMLYNGMDVIATDIVAGSLFKELCKDSSLKSVWDNNVKNLIPILAEMEHHGFEIDHKELSSLTTYWTTINTNSKEFLQSKVAHWFKDFNPGSHVQVKKLMYDYLDQDIKRWIKRSKKTGNRSPSVDATTLQRMKVTCKDKAITAIIDALLAFNKSKTMMSTFLTTFKEKSERSIDHRLHTNFNIHVVETGRLSSSNPPLQNMPTSEALIEKGYKPIKTLFVSRFHYGMLVQGDGSQLELRVAAMYVPADETFRRAFIDGKDLHGEMAAKIYGPKYTKDQRTRAKRTNFSAVFDIWADTLADQLNITSAEAQKLLDTFRSMHPELYKWFDLLWEQAKQDGFARSFMGRKRHIGQELTDSGTYTESIKRQVWNFPIQCTAWELTSTCLINLHRRLKEGRMKSVIIGTVHDSIIVDCPDSEAQTVAHWMRAEFERLNTVFEWATVPLKMDVSYGINLHNKIDLK